jgi:hypothetical protein
VGNGYRHRDEGSCLHCVLENGAVEKQKSMI